MFSLWWPFNRRRDNPRRSSVSNESIAARRLEETRRLVKQVAQEAIRADQPPSPVVDTTISPKPTVTLFEGVTHVNFHCSAVLFDGIIVRKDPITSKLKRIAKRFDRSDVFYTEDGRLIGD